MTKPRRTSRSQTRTSGKSGNAWDIQDKAFKEFEKAVGLLQKQNHAQALERFQAIQEQFPGEKELNDRVRCYVRICQSQVERKSTQPRKPEEFFYHGVLRANDADFDNAVSLLDRALQMSPKDEKVHYVLASTLALKGDRGEAVRHLREAIELNSTNRIYARNDPDFETIRDDETFQDLVYPEEM